MGEVPDWYEMIVAARYLRVAPWELHAQPAIWKQWGLAAQAAENEYRKIEQDRNKPKTPRR